VYFDKAVGWMDTHNTHCFFFLFQKENKAIMVCVCNNEYNFDQGRQREVSGDGYPSPPPSHTHGLLHFNEYSSRRKRGGGGGGREVRRPQPVCMILLSISIEEQEVRRSPSSLRREGVWGLGTRENRNIGYMEKKMVCSAHSGERVRQRGGEGISRVLG